MARRVLLSTYHSIAEHDDLALLAGLGYEVLSLGAYLDPAHPGDDKRPALPEVPMAPPGVVDACRDTHTAKQDLPPIVLDWLGRDGAIVWHHFPELMWAQWPKLREWGGRVIWRSCGQSNGGLEQAARWFRTQGMERVAYSPKEANLPNYAGHDAVIRFYADPDVWGGWTGEHEVVTNVTQRLFQRGSACNPEFWLKATEGLPTMPIGEGSDVMPTGLGVVGFDDMRAHLRSARAYLYTGTQPAAYTLGFIEAAMTGIPIVSIGPKAWASQAGVEPSWFEAHEMAYSWGTGHEARVVLQRLLDSEDLAREASGLQRAVAIELFAKDTIGAQWRTYLGEEVMPR